MRKISNVLKYKGKKHMNKFRCCRCCRCLECVNVHDENIESIKSAIKYFYISWFLFIAGTAFGLICFRCLGELNSYAAGVYSTLIASSLKYVCILLIFTEIVFLILFMKNKKINVSVVKKDPNNDKKITFKKRIT